MGPGAGRLFRATATPALSLEGKWAKFFRCTARRTEHFDGPCTGEKELKDGTPGNQGCVVRGAACPLGPRRGAGPPLTHPQAAEVVQPAADERAGVRQQHLHAQIAAEAVEAVEERAAGAEQQQQAAAAQRLLAQGLDAVVGEAERQQQRGQHDGRVRAVQTLQPVAAQARERALEGVQEGAAQHGPQQRPQEGLQDEVDEHRGAAAQAHEQHSPRVVEGLLDGLVEAQRQCRRPRGLPAAAAAASGPDLALDSRHPARGAPWTGLLGGAAAVGHSPSAPAAKRRYWKGKREAGERGKARGAQHYGRCSF